MPTNGPVTTLTDRVQQSDAEIKFLYDISFVDCEPSDAVRTQIEEHLRKLNHLYDRITDCRVTLRIAHKQSKHKFFHIHILLDLPGKRIAVSRDPETRANEGSAQHAVRDAFHKLTRQLEDFLHVRNGQARGPKIAPPQQEVLAADDEIE